MNRFSQARLLLLAALFTASSAATASGVERSDRVDPYWDVTQPRGATRTIEFTTDEGTAMSVDISPDQRWLVFDLLGHIYRVPSSGGHAQSLTADSGIALNFHPVFSPDGTRIAFVSDRTGQNNLWVMDIDGGNPRPMFLDATTRISEPAWAPDGKSIVAVRSFATPGRGWHRVNTQLWRFPMDGTRPQLLISGEQEQYNSPSISPDGKFVYFHISYFSGNRFGTQSGHRLQQLPIEYRLGKLTIDSGEVIEVSKHDGPPPSWRDYQVTSSSSMPPDSIAQIMPLQSPDGRFLAFAQEMPGHTFDYRGHRHGPSTALIVRDLQTGAEQVLIEPISKDLTSAHAMYAYRVLPRFAWTADSKAIVLSIGGKLQRVELASGQRKEIAFEADVRRVISEMTRGNVKISDDTFAMSFLQWPSASPDGTQLAFVAAGKVWIHDFASGVSRELHPAPKGTLQFTPAWSPEGTRIAWTEWNEKERGRVVVIDNAAGITKTLTSAPGEYLYPTWRNDGRELLVSAGPGPAGRRDGWQAAGDWTIARLDAKSGAMTNVTKTDRAKRASYGPAGEILFASFDDPAMLPDLYQPWPSTAARQQVTQLSAVRPDGVKLGTRAMFPPAMLVEPIDPIPSPDGRWVAFRVDDEAFIAPLTPSGTQPQTIHLDPNHPAFSAVRVSTVGASDPTWLNDHMLQFASGDKYLTYDIQRRSLRERTVPLSLPRYSGKGTLALTNARVITMEGDRVLEKATVLIDGARIRCVGECDMRQATRVIDLRGRTVMPGLVDVHEHIADSDGRPVGVAVPSQGQHRLALSYGVTTYVDPSANAEAAFPLAQLVETGAVIGPRVFTTAEVVIPASTAFGQRTFIRSPGDAERLVNRRAQWGAISIKNFRNESRDQQQKLIAAARSRGLTVTGEGGPLIFDLGVIMDGQTGWEHYLADLPVYKDFTRFAGAAGITFSPTVSVAGHPEGAMLYFRPRHDFTRDRRYQLFSPDEAPKRDTSPLPPLERFSFPIVAEGLADILRAGGHGAIGEHAEQPGIGSHWEIWSYATALTPQEALRVATIDGARFVGLEHELGSVSAGKLADLLILSRDPLRNIRNTTSIDMVMKAGRLYESETLQELWPKQ